MKIFGYMASPVFGIKTVIFAGHANNGECYEDDNYSKNKIKYCMTHELCFETFLACSHVTNIENFHELPTSKASLSEPLFFLNLQCH